MVRRARFADGTPKPPPPKPERNFFDKLKTLKQVSKGISPESRIRLLDYFIQEALTKGQLTEEQASGIYNQLQREDKDKSPRMKELLDNYKAEYNNAYKQILLFPERPITEEFVEKLLDARKKLMEYGYLSEEERRYHQDILDATQKTIDRFQKDPNFKIERKDVADGGRIGFGEGTKTKLVEFVEKFKLQNNRAPTIMEVADGAKSSTASIRKYLNEGVDFVKTDLSTVGKAGGTASGVGKKTGVTKLNEKAYKELQDLRIKGISFQTTKGVGGSVSVGIRIQNPKVAEAFFGPKKVTNYFPGDAKGIAQLKNLVEQIAVSDVYANNVLPFQTDEYKRKIKRFKEAQYKKKDPFGVYKALQKYKTEVFPGDYSKQVQIQHGDAKFTAQTLSRMGLIDAAANISPEVEKAERLRNNALKTTMATLDNPDASVAAKKAAAEKYNSIAKGLRGQLKGTPGQGFVNFQLLEVDDSGNYKKLKDISFDPKKGLVDSDLDLSKITKEEADDLIAKGKKKLDLEAVKLKTGLNLKNSRSST